MSKNIKLTYFNLNGRAMVPRFILSTAKVEFTDEQFTFEQWGKEAPNHEYNQLPQLNIDGRVFSQSHAICHYLAKKYAPELLGKNHEEEYEVQNLVFAVEDIAGHLFALILNQDPSKRQGLLEVAESELKRFVGVWEKKYSANGAGKYYLGDYITLADVTLDYFQYLVTVIIPDLEKTFAGLAPTLNKIILGNRESGPIKEFRDSKFFITKSA